MIPKMLAAAPGRTGGELSKLKEESVGRDQESGFGWLKWNPTQRLGVGRAEKKAKDWALGWSNGWLGRREDPVKEAEKVAKEVGVT